MNPAHMWQIADHAGPGAAHDHVAHHGHALVDAAHDHSAHTGHHGPALVVAFVVTTPVNIWLIGRGKGHAVVHSPHGGH
ncbi:hypothetical protein [Nocardia sp. NPDC050710]|uniref:hypothetical protein n=1 Tax=Nocardia sp. NPDC050710 TaxID=3157220 RepID=UPI0033CD15A7